MRKEVKTLILFVVVFLGAFYLPLGQPRFDNALFESLHLLKEYAREHVVLCLVPAFLIAGAISVFINKASVIRYMGAKAPKVLAYSVASVSGSVLAVCSCTVLPLFAGIYRMGAGLGPASAFLYSGPAINVLAIILTARVLGLEMGIARAIGAVLFSVVIGLLMHLIFRKEEASKCEAQGAMAEADVTRPLWQNGIYFATMIAILVFANFGSPDQAVGLWASIHSHKWLVTGGLSALLGVVLVRWFGVSGWKIAIAGVPAVVLALILPGYPMVAFAAGIAGLSTALSWSKGEPRDWLAASWGFAKQIAPLLFFGVLVAGALLGRPNHEGLIPASWVQSAVGGNSMLANLFASVVGAFMYFATLTEVPILQGLLGAGMGKGPALALLLAGPALSLPNMLVIRSILGTKKTVAYVALVVVMSAAMGVLFGTFF